MQNTELRLIKQRITAFCRAHGKMPDKIIMSAQQRVKFEIDDICGVPIVIGNSGIHLVANIGGIK